MTFDPRAIGAQIRMKIPQLTPLEKRVVDTVMGKKDLSEKTSLKDIAADNDVSEAMVVKATKKLGFSGFRDFRTSLIHYNNSDVASLHSEIKQGDSSRQLLDKVFRSSIQALEETKAILNVAEFDRAAAILFKANNIDLYGVGGSSSIAQDLSHKLLKIGVKAVVRDDVHIMMMSAAILDDDDVVIVISHSGMTRSVIEPAKLASRNGAKIIAITNFDSSPLVDAADVVLHSTSQGSHLLGENAASRIAQLNILDTLFVAIAKKDLAKAELNLRKTQQAVRNLREY